MNEIQAEIVKLAGLSNLTQQNGIPDKQQKQKNTNLKSKQTHEKQYLYPLSNFMKSSSLEENNELLTASVRMKVKSLPGKDTSPTRLVVMDTFKTMGSKDFINCIDDEEGDANVQREPESRIDLHHHVWAEQLCEDADIEGNFFLWWSTSFKEVGGLRHSIRKLVDNVTWSILPYLWQQRCFCGPYIPKPQIQTSKQIVRGYLTYKLCYCRLKQFCQKVVRINPGKIQSVLSVKQIEPRNCPVWR